MIFETKLQKFGQFFLIYKLGWFHDYLSPWLDHNCISTQIDYNVTP
jgi:hypothetical protein